MRVPITADEMATMRKNELVVRTAYSAIGAWDLEMLSGLIADDIEWIVGGRNMLTAFLHGKPEVFAWLAMVEEITGGRLSFDVRYVDASPWGAVTGITMTAERDGVMFTDSHKHGFNLTDGKITQFALVVRDEKGEDRFWGERTTSEELRPPSTD